DHVLLRQVPAVGQRAGAVDGLRSRRQVVVVAGGVVAGGDGDIAGVEAGGGEVAEVVDGSAVGEAGAQPVVVEVDGAAAGVGARLHGAAVRGRREDVVPRLHRLRRIVVGVDLDDRRVGGALGDDGVVVEAQGAAIVGVHAAVAAEM